MLRKKPDSPARTSFIQTILIGFATLPLLLLFIFSFFSGAGFDVPNHKPITGEPPQPLARTIQPQYFDRFWVFPNLYENAMETTSWICSGK